MPTSATSKSNKPNKTLQQQQDGEDPTPTERTEEERSSKVWPLHLVHLHIPAAALLFSVPQPTLVRTAGRLCGRADDGIVLGENSSGAGYMTGVLKKAFGDDVAMMHETPQRRDMLEQTELDEIVERRDILWIMVTRSPCEWADEIINTKRRKCAESQSTSKLCSVESTKDYYSMEWREEPEDESGERIIVSTLDEDNGGNPSTCQDCTTQ
eukprot:scaffold11607_cov67-Skeletonema_marinoi.AAC.2